MSKESQQEEQKKPRYETYQDFFRRMSENYGSMPAANIQAAMSRALPFSSMYTLNPYVQNRRVKAIDSLPEEYGKNEIADMLRKPLDNETGLRQVSNILEYTAYPMFKLRSTYQNLLTYHYYIFPDYDPKGKADSDALLREWDIVERVARELQIQRVTRQIVGQCVRDGKAFYTPRCEVDKSHHSVRRAFMQQLPQDWVKIVGFNNLSKYTVAFNMFYFLQPGTSYTQFGDLFEPYIKDFLSGFKQDAKPPKKGVITANRENIDYGAMYALQQRAGTLNGTPDIYSQNGTWYYWVYLPADKVWTFEVDDVKPAVVSPFTGLMLSMAQIAQYEQVQLEIVQNPLVSLVLAQMETFDAVSPTEADPIKVSPGGRTYFENLFYQMLQSNNTGGIGIFPAPFKDMKLVSLPESPNANKISSAGYEYAMEKSGMSALIPTNSEARAGVAQISLMLESRFAQHIYWQISRMMEVLFESMNTQWHWRFVMFGDVATDEAEKKEAKEGMTHGILPMTLRYDALHDMSVLDDLSISSIIDASGILDKRKPLITSYSAKSMNPNLPPTETGAQGGRPETDKASSEGKEGDMDDAKGVSEL